MTGQKSKSWERIGEILVSKQNKLYIKIKQDVELTAGSQIMIQDPRTRLQEAVAAGRMDEQKAEELLAKIPSFLRYELVLPPPRD